jgi:hypothetical protein
VCGFNMVAINEYDKLDREVLMFCIRIKCRKIRSNYIHKG